MVETVKDDAAAVDVGAAVNEEEGNHKAFGNADDDETEALLLPQGFAMVDLDKDIYSLMFTGDLKGPGFWFGLFVAVFQGGIVTLVLLDLVDWGSDTNPLRIPPGNQIFVTVAQAFLMVLMSQDSMDIMEGLEFLIDGYHPEVLQLCPHAYIWKWFLAGFSHVIVGALLSTCIFILLMQETTVFGLGVDFVAMNKFFAMIDNTAFKIAKRGVFSVPLQDEIKNVGKVKIRKNEFYTWSRRARDMVMIAVVMTGYGLLTYQQQHGYFLCDHLFVQFGDVFNPGIVEISGMFDRLGLDKKHDNRAVYSERTTGQFRFAYCLDLRKWTMTPYLNGIFDPCGSEVDVLASSGVYDGFSILDTVDTWSVDAVRHGSGLQPFTHFSMQCDVCSKSCTSGGTCDDNDDCICSQGNYGVNCELKQPCPNMTVSLATESFPPYRSDYAVPNDFTMLTLADGYSAAPDFINGTLQVEYRPVYFAEGLNTSWIMAFLGRRWVIYGGRSEYMTKANLVDWISGPDYSSIDSVFAPIYVSSPVDIGTPSDGATPADLSWFYATRKFQGNAIEANDELADPLDDDTPRPYATTWWVEENQPLSARFICSLCDSSTNPCKNNGVCVETTQTCSCSKEVGALCEYEVKCTDPDASDPDSIAGCPYNATCGLSGKCAGCPDGYLGNTCQQEI